VGTSSSKIIFDSRGIGSIPLDDIPTQAKRLLGDQCKFSILLLFWYVSCEYVVRVTETHANTETYANIKTHANKASVPETLANKTLVNESETRVFMMCDPIIVS
jgi:hypothetical protein